MSKQKQQQTIATIIALLIITEIVLHFCWKVLDAWIFENFTVSAGIGIIALILLLVVLFFQEELVFGLAGGGKVSRLRSRLGHHYGGIARAGRFGVMEALVFIGYVLFAGACIGILSVSLGMEMKTIVLLGAITAGFILLFQKAQLRFTALEMATFAICVLIPLMASGVISQLTLPAEWLSDGMHKLMLWGACCVSAVIMAFQD